MRVLVTGSRNWENVDGVIDALREYAVPGNTLVSGHCPRGADLIAEWAWTKHLGMPQESLVLFPADWENLGPTAGNERNIEMLESGIDLVLAFMANCRKRTCRRKEAHVSHGTAHCVFEAMQRNIKVKEHRAWRDPVDIGG